MSFFLVTCTLHRKKNMAEFPIKPNLPQEDQVHKECILTWEDQKERTKILDVIVPRDMTHILADAASVCRQLEADEVPFIDYFASEQAANEAKNAIQDGRRVFRLHVSEDAVLGEHEYECFIMIPKALDQDERVSKGWAAEWMEDEQKRTVRLECGKSSGVPRRATHGRVSKESMLDPQHHSPRVYCFESRDAAECADRVGGADWLVCEFYDLVALPAPGEGQEKSPVK